MDDLHLASCGYNCTKCPVYIKTKESDLEGLKSLLFASYNQEHTIESLGCYGCMDKRSKNTMCSNCYIKKCAIKHNINNCGCCDEFPCIYLTNYISNDTMEKLKEIKKNNNN